MARDNRRRSPRRAHTAERKSPTVVEAGRLWLQTALNAGLERSTLEYYRQHVELHIAPLLGTVRLSQLTAPTVRAFEDRLRADRSRPWCARRSAHSRQPAVTQQPRGVPGRRGNWVNGGFGQVFQEADLRWHLS